MFDYLKINFKYYYNLLFYYINILVFSILLKILKRFNRFFMFLRLFFDSSIPYGKIVTSSIFSFRFLFFNMIYLVQVIIFIFLLFIKKLFSFIKSLFILTTIISLIDFYLSVTGQHLSDFSPSTLSYSLVFFVIWLFSLFSRKFSDNFLGSEFPEYQPFIEDSGITQDIYSVVEPDLFLAEDEDDNDFDDFPFSVITYADAVNPSLLKNKLDSFNSRSTVFKYKASTGLPNIDNELELSRQTVFGNNEEDLDNLLEYEGVSLDFSDGEYFDIENKELLYWLKNNASLYNLLKNFLSGKSSKQYLNDTIMNLVPKYSFRYSVNSQRFLIYVESLHLLNMLLSRNFFFDSKTRMRQELSEIYSSYVFPYYKYYRRMFNVSFEEGPFSGDFSEDTLFSEHPFYEFYNDKDSSNLFSEYDFDEAEDDFLEYLNNEVGYDEDEDDPESEIAINPEEDDEFEFFMDVEELEEDWDDVEEEGFDFFIPGEVPFSEKFLFKDKISNALVSANDFVPFEFSAFYKSEMFDDLLLVEKSLWVSELLVDRFLIDITDKYDVSFEHDFLLLAKIHEYGPDFFDQNILNLKTNRYREFYFKFFRSLKKVNVGFMTTKLKRTLGMLNLNSDALNMLTSYYVLPIHPDADFYNNVDLTKVQTKFNDFDFNAHFLNSINKKRVFFVVHHPYNINKEKDLDLKIYPLLGHQAFDNKYKRKFFKNPMFYIKMLDLKNYPDLTLAEFQRLCIFLGCTKQEWDSIDTKPVRITRPYDSIDFPLMFTLMLFFSQAKNWFRYEIMDPRYYLDGGLHFLDRLLCSWWFSLDEMRLAQRQTINEVLEYDMPFATIYLTLKDFLTNFSDLIYYFHLFVVEFSKGNISSFYEFVFSDSYAVSYDSFYSLKYFYVFQIYIQILYNYKYLPLFLDFSHLCLKFFDLILWFFSFIVYPLINFKFLDFDLIINFASFYSEVAIWFISFISTDFFESFSTKFSSCLVYYFSAYYYVTGFSLESFVFLYPLFPLFFSIFLIVLNLFEIFFLIFDDFFFSIFSFFFNLFYFVFESLIIYLFFISSYFFYFFKLLSFWDFIFFICYLFCIFILKILYHFFFRER